ncbi:MAG TPA: helix-turn-helix domain-containing protein, partial [Thermodesulfobacteriota bacterium]|nr:helix-turn-helix domain-containing protein [Thermodesulfobacteriota bacterium]
YHLFIKTPHANISPGMHYLNTSYTNWFKAEHKVVGVIFQGRYKSILVDEDNYGLRLSAYIHLNPVRAGIVADVKEYEWSSYQSYIGKRSPVERLNTEFILGQLDGDMNKARRKYKRFVLENMDMVNPMRDSYRGLALGSEEFMKRIEKKIKSLGRKREVTETKMAGTCSLEEVIGSIMSSFGVEREEIFRKKKGNIYRQMALYLIKKYTMLSLKEIGEVFGMDYAAVSQACKRFERLSEKNRKVSGMVTKLKKDLMANRNS